MCLTACGETQAAFERRCIPPEPRRFAALCVAFRSKYTRYSSLTRLVSRAPRPHRENWPLSALTRVPPQAVNTATFRVSGSDQQEPVLDDGAPNPEFGLGSARVGAQRQAQLGLRIVF